MSTKRSENACPHGEFIRAFAIELGVSQAVAKHIYTVFYVTILKQLKTYDAVNITPFLEMSRRMTKSKRMYDLNNGCYINTVPTEKFYCRIATCKQNVEAFDSYLQNYEERLRKQEEYAIQEEQEREEREAEKARRKEELARERRNKRRRTKYRRRKEAERARAIERMIHYESILEQHEKEKYRKELARRKKGYK